MLARKVVLATGQEGVGGTVDAGLRRGAAAARCAPMPGTRSTSRRCAGKVVAVLGAGASAFDNAAVALEAGAAEVHLFCRRAEPMIVQPYRWLTFAGFLRHLHEMPDAWRWRFMAKILGMREGFAQDTYDRANAHPELHHAYRPALDRGARGGRARGAGDARAATSPRISLICGTGVRMDPARCRNWPAAPTTSRSGATATRRRPRKRMSGWRSSPTSRPTYAFVEKPAGRDALDPRHPPVRHRHQHVLRPGGVVDQRHEHRRAAGRAGVTRGLFEADLPRLHAELEAYAVPQVTLDPARLAAE